MNPRQSHIDWIKYLIETEEFEVKDFLLTAPRARPFRRERRRQQIMQLMCRCGISAHDLVSDLPPSPGADGGELPRAAGDAS